MCLPGYLLQYEEQCVLTTNSQYVHISYLVTNYLTDTRIGCRGHTQFVNTKKHNTYKNKVTAIR